MEFKTLLKATPLLAAIDQADLAGVLAIVRKRSLKKREILFFEGEPAKGFFLLLKGRVKIYKTSADGREVILHLISPGQSFAEAALFSGKGYPAHGEALESSLVAFFPKEPLLDLIRNTPSLSLKMMAGLAAFVRELNQQVEDLSLREVPARLAAFLLRESQSLSEKRITINISRREWATRLGTVIETLSRNLKRLSDSGAIEVRGRSIRILDQAFLEKVAQGIKKAVL